MLYMTLLGFGLAVVAIFSGHLLDGASLSMLVQPAAFLIVAGGTAGAVVAQCSPKDFLMGLNLLRWLFEPPVSAREDAVREIVGWARVVHRDGALKLDRLSGAIDDALMKSGVEMIVDRCEAEHVRDSLLMQVRARNARLQRAARMWESAGAYAPTVGILGSVLGLLQVMHGLGDTSRLGAGIATAFVATIYGLALANLVFLPLAAKLRAMIFELTLRDELRIEGLAMIAANKHPWMVERALVAGVERSDNVVALRRAA